MQEAHLSSNSSPAAATDHELTVILPAWNEQLRLPASLAALRAFLENWGVNYRVLVVDDGSIDDTSAIAEGFGPRFSVLRLGQRSGKGRAVRTGMLRATGAVLAFSDVDLPYDLSALRDGYERIRQGDCRVVFGARDLAPSRSLVERRSLRKIGSYVFRRLSERLISREVRDTQCGMKLFERQAALEIFSRATVDGFAFDCEVVLTTEHLGLPFRRIPVTLVNDDASTVSLLRDTVPILLDVLRLGWHARHRVGPPHRLPRPESERTIESAGFVKHTA
jgi:dolichyl-phosphate beta-glucosyltransferase